MGDFGLGMTALERWLEPFRRGTWVIETRRRMCPAYVAGLIGPGDRKSVQPMAALLASGDYDQLKSRKSSAKKQKRAAVEQSTG